MSTHKCQCHPTTPTVVGIVPPAHKCNCGGKCGKHKSTEFHPFIPPFPKTQQSTETLRKDIGMAVRQFSPDEFAD